MELKRTSILLKKLIRLDPGSGKIPLRASLSAPQNSVTDCFAPLSLNQLQKNDLNPHITLYMSHQTVKKHCFRMAAKGGVSKDRKTCDPPPRTHVARMKVISTESELSKTV